MRRVPKPLTCSLAVIAQKAISPNACSGNALYVMPPTTCPFFLRSATDLHDEQRRKVTETAWGEGQCLTVLAVLGAEQVERATASASVPGRAAPARQTDCPVLTAAALQSPVELVSTRWPTCR